MGRVLPHYGITEVHGGTENFYFQQDPAFYLLTVAVLLLSVAISSYQFAKRDKGDGQLTSDKVVLPDVELHDAVEIVEIELPTAMK